MRQFYNRSEKHRLLIDVAFAIIAFTLYSFIPLVIMIDPSQAFYYSIAALILAFVFFLLCYRFIRRLNPSFQIKHVKPSYAIGIILATLIGSFILQSIIGQLRFWLLPEEASTSNQQSIAGMLQVDSLLFYSFVTIVFIAPLFEEFIFRRVLIGHLFAPKKILQFRIALSLVIFALLHVFSEVSNGVLPFLFSLITYLIVSGCFTIIYVKTGRMLYSVIAHILNNALAAIMLFSTL